MLSDSQEVSTTDSSSEDQDSLRQPRAEQLAWELPAMLNSEHGSKEHQGQDQPQEEERNQRAKGQSGSRQRRKERPLAPTDTWPPLPDGLRLPPPTQATYPDIPGTVGRIIDSVTRISGCSRPIAALGVLGALSALGRI